MPPTFDPYGLEYDDWEDPYDHVFLTMCTGCPMCAPWEGRLYDQIRAERIALVCRRRAAAHPEQPTSEMGREDREYWNIRYSD